jgi:hypothetical protein
MNNYNPTFVNISQYLLTNNFVPHKGGNMMNYGLNSFGCDSVIEYNDDIWKFVLCDNIFGCAVQNL